MGVSLAFVAFPRARSHGPRLIILVNAPVPSRLHVHDHGPASDNYHGKLSLEHGYNFLILACPSVSKRTGSTAGIRLRRQYYASDDQIHTMVDR